MGNEELIGPVYYPPGILVAQPSMIYQQQSIGQLLSIRLKRYDYYPGEYVEGNVIFQSPSQIVLNDIYLNLILSQGWNVFDEIPLSELNQQIITSIYLGIAKILKVKLNPNSNLISLNPGAYNFPFMFKLPDNLQPSFEFPLDNARGFLRYVLKAQIASQYTRGETNLYLFIKARPLLLRCPLEYTAEPNVQKWGMINQGSTKLKVSYKTTTYQMKGQIPFTVDIDNTRGKAKVNCVKVKLIRRVQFIKLIQNQIKFNLEKIINKKSFDVNVPPNTISQKFNYIMEINDTTLNTFNYMGTINPYPRLAEKFYVMPNTYSQVIKCEYFLIVSLDFSSFVTKGYLPKVCLPLFICPQSIDEYNKETKEDADLKKAIEASLLDMKKNKDINIDNKQDNNNGDEILFEKPKKEGEINENDEINIIKNEENINDENIHINNNISENNISNENDNKNININEIKEENNISNKNQININEIEEANYNNNINNINNKKDDKDEIIDPYLADSQNNINISNSLPKNFSINDIEDENDNEINDQQQNKNNKKGEEDFSVFN